MPAEDITKKQWQETTFEYDIKGNLVGIQKDDEITKFLYDTTNLLIRTTKNELVTSYEYDGLMRRVGKEANGELTRYVNDITSLYNDILSLITPNETQNRYYGNSFIASQVSKGDIYYSLLDDMGSTIRMTNEKGRTASIYQYYIFGNIQNRGTAPKSPGFTGYEEDEGTDILFVQARYYMPSIGRFVEEDADRGDLENSISLNRYVHCYNNPMFYVDRDGHRPVSIGAIIQQRMDQYGSNGESVRRTENSVIVTIRGKEKEYYFSLADNYGLGEVYFNGASFLTINHEQLMKDFGLSKEQATITTSDYLTNKEFVTVSGMLNYYPDSLMNPIELYIVENIGGKTYSFICQDQYSKNGLKNDWKLGINEQYTLGGENLYNKNKAAVGAKVNLSAYEIYFIPKKTAREHKSEHERKLKDIEDRFQDYKPLIGKNSIEKRAIEEENERYAKQKVMMVSFNA